MKRIYVVLIFLPFYGAQAGVFDWWSSFDFMRAEHAYSGGDVGEAQRLFEQLTVERPYDVKVICGLADCAYTQNQYTRSQTYYENLLAAAPSDEIKEKLWFNVGCAQAQQKEFKQALVSFEKVVALNKDNKRAHKNIEILKKLLEQQKQKNKSKNNENNKNKKEQQKEPSENTKKDTDQKDQQHDNSTDNRDRDNKQQQGNQQQPNQSRDQHGNQDTKNTAQNNQSEHNQQASDQQRQEHDTSSQQQNQNTQKNGVKQLDKQAHALLCDINTLDQQGQHLYLRALAGQSNEQKRGAHDW